MRFSQARSVRDYMSPLVDASLLSHLPLLMREQSFACIVEALGSSALMFLRMLEDSETVFVEKDTNPGASS